MTSETLTLDVLKEATEWLSYEDRHELSRHLSNIELTPEEYKRAWGPIIRRRIAEGEDGTVKCTPLAEFMEEMKAKYP